MESLKESLHRAIELLGDEEAHELLDMVQHLRKGPVIPPSRRGLASDPIFSIPTAGAAFRIVQPIDGRGIPASRLLVENRR